MKSELRILAAESEVERARAQLVETVGDFAEMLEPRRIVGEVWDSAKAKSADLAEDAVEAVKNRPVAATGVVAALTMFLAREPMRRGIVNIYDALTSSKEDEAVAPKSRAAKPKAPSKPAAPRKRTATRSKKNDPEKG